MIRKLTAFLAVLALAAGLITQSLAAARTLNDRYSAKVLGNRNLDAFTRSADASYGGGFAAYIASLRAALPERATVLIPPAAASSGPQNDLNLMQYLLFPRTIVTCGPDCSAAIAAPGTYVLVQGDFPPAAALSGAKHLVDCAGAACFYAPGP